MSVNRARRNRSASNRVDFPLAREQIRPYRGRAAVQCDPSETSEAATTLADSRGLALSAAAAAVDDGAAATYTVGLTERSRGR